MACPELVRLNPPPRAAQPLVCVVMDGVGIGQGGAGDAVAQASTPNLDRYAQGPLACRLRAHGTAVGMPSDADMGNSEVGHNAMGAGRVFEQGASLVQAALRTGAIWEGAAWGACMERARAGALHLVGLLSDGNVHSHIDHLLALVDRAHAEEARHVFVHVLLDGRDVARTSALDYVDRLEAHLARLDRGPKRLRRIASGGGRMRVTMDRYRADWAMVERGWHLHVLGEGPAAPSARAAIESQRAIDPDLGDQDLAGFVVHDRGRPVGPIRDGDAVIAFNFRGDRMIELCEAFEAEDFRGFRRGPRPDVVFAGMTQYDGDAHLPARFLVSPPAISCTLSELLSTAGLAQLAVSETQKFGHVTYFWNGNRQAPFDPALERRIEVPSHPPPFDRRPGMRAKEIVDAVVEALAERPAAFVRVNFANGDMVGHTGNFAATCEAVAAVDAALGRLEQAVLGAGGALMVTGDHGNAEEMFERDAKGDGPRRDAAGRPVAKTSHTLNPVPLYVVAPPALAGQWRMAPPANAGLANLAATAALLLGFAPPPHMAPPLVCRADGAGR